MRWRTRIEEWQPEDRFVDVQLEGPYRLWRHLHTFEDRHDGTLMRDRVEYALPFGPLGWLAHRVLVARQLDSIFSHRREVIARVLG